MASDGDKYAQFKAAGKNGAAFLLEPGIEAELDTIQAKIIDAFKKASDDISLFKQYPENEKLLQWIQKMHAADARLMVRSSGDEDSAIANAGGNMSFSDVAANPQKVIAAAGKVVASYFSLSSLKNRLLAQDNPFKTTPKMAVLLQEQVAEPIGGAKKLHDIPTGVVMFTDEPFYTGNEIGSSRWILTRISALPGHNEAVVGNFGLLPDTIYVLQSRSNPGKLNIFYDNQRKETRRGPMLTDSGEVENTFLDNPEELVNRRALSDEMIYRLFDLGQKIQEHAAEPTDMEIILHRGIIKPVQARAVNRLEAQPTYIDPKMVSENPTAFASKTKAKVLVDGRASAVVVDSSDKVLLTSKLQDAEEDYQEQTHALVIVGKDESSNSHPVVNFSGLGVPCLFHPKLNQLEKALVQAGTNRQVLAADMQSGWVYLWNENVLPIASLIKEGYRTHPAPMSFSLEIPHPPIRIPGKEVVNIPPDLQDLLAAIEIAETNRVATLTLVRQHSFVVALPDKIEQLRGRLSVWGPLATAQANRTFATAQALQNVATQALDEYESTLKLTAPSRLETLFRAKVLETLLFEPDGSSSVGSFSYLNIDEAIEATHLAQSYQAELSFPAQFVDEFLVGHDTALTPELEQGWQQFMVELEQNVQQGTLTAANANQFRELLRLAKESDALSSWITLIFDLIQQDYVSAPAILKAILAEYNLVIQKFVKDLGKLRIQQNQLRATLSLLSDPKTFQQGFSPLKQLAESYVLNMPKGYIETYLWSNEPQGFIQTYKQSSRMGKLLAVQAMNDFIDLYDSAVKALLSSTKYRKDLFLKAAKFKEMLLPFIGLLKTWIKELVQERPITHTRSYKYSQLGTYHHKLSGLSNMEYLTVYFELKANQLSMTPEQLKSTPEFDVRHFSIESGAVNLRLRKVGPQTLNDLFTVSHQSLLAVGGFLFSDLVPDELLQRLRLPSLLFEAVSKSNPYSFDIKRIGLNFSKRAIKIIYNYPLREHSSVINFQYNKGDAGIIIDLLMVGEEEGGRKATSLAYFSSLSALGFISLSEPPVEGIESLQVKFRADNSQRLNMIIRETEIVLRYTSSAQQYSLLLMDAQDRPHAIQAMLHLSKTFKPTRLNELKWKQQVTDILPLLALFDKTKNDQTIHQFVDFLKSSTRSLFHKEEWKYWRDQFEYAPEHYLMTSLLPVILQTLSEHDFSRLIAGISSLDFENYRSFTIKEGLIFLTKILAAGKAIRPINQLARQWALEIPMGLSQEINQEHQIGALMLFSVLIREGHCEPESLKMARQFHDRLTQNLPNSEKMLFTEHLTTLKKLLDGIKGGT